MKFENISNIYIIAICMLYGSDAASVNIIDGVPAERGEFPYMVSLMSVSGDTTTHICGASIVDVNYIVTACHCVADKFPSQLKVVAGAYNLDQNEETQQIAGVLRIYKHPNYNGTSNRIRNDIAMIQVSPPFTFNENVTFVSFPSRNHQAGGMCKIAGWGMTNHGSRSDVLLKGSVPIVSKDTCQQSYEDSLDRENQICAGNGFVDSCTGDTGGGLLCNDTGRYYIAGISSYGYYCGIPNWPGVYTETSRYIDWLQNPIPPTGTNNNLPLPKLNIKYF